MPFAFQPVFDRALPYAPFLAKHATPDNRARWQTVYDAAGLTEDQRALLATFRRHMRVLCLSGPWCGDCVNACPLFQRIAEARADLIDLRFVNRAQRFDPPPSTTPPDITPAVLANAPARVVTVPTGDDDIRSRPFGRWLVKMGIITEERVEKALLVQEENRSKGLNAKIGDVMTEMGLITDTQRDAALAQQSGFATLDEADRQVALELSLCGAPRVPVLLFLSEDGYECERFGERTLATYRDKAAKQLANTQGATCPTGLFAPPGTLLATNLAEWLSHFERVQWMLLTSPRLMKLHGEV